MKATSRALRGEQYAGWELSVPAGDTNANIKLFKEAIRLLKDHDPMGVTISGVFLDISADELTLDLIFSV